MSLVDNIFEDKHCFIYCGDDACNCKNGLRYRKYMMTQLEQEVLDRALEKSTVKVAEGRLVRSNDLTEDEAAMIVSHVGSVYVTPKEEQSDYDRAMEVVDDNSRTTG